MLMATSVAIPYLGTQVHDTSPDEVAATTHRAARLTHDTGQSRLIMLLNPVGPGCLQ